MRGPANRGERPARATATCSSDSSAAASISHDRRVVCRGAFLQLVLPHHRLWRHHAGFDGGSRAGFRPHDHGALRFKRSRRTAVAVRAGAQDIDVKLGQVVTVYYAVTNEAARATVGQAGYSVSPPTSGIYFEKINCFCFTEQTMKPGEKRDMAVVFYVDPKLAADSEQDGLNLITLSYTFYPVRPALPPAHAGAGKDQAVVGSTAAEKSGRI